MHGLMAVSMGAVGACVLSIQRYVQEGAFMVVCLRCPQEAMTAAACRAVLERLRHPTTAKLMASVLSKRERVPFASEFPIVGGSSLQELPELLGHIQEQLEDIMGISTDVQVGEWASVQKQLMRLSILPLRSSLYIGYVLEPSSETSS
jgi:hypothetical protein